MGEYIALDFLSIFFLFITFLFSTVKCWSNTIDVFVGYKLLQQKLYAWCLFSRCWPQYYIVWVNHIYKANMKYRITFIRLYVLSLTDVCSWVTLHSTYMCHAFKCSVLSRLSAFTGLRPPQALSVLWHFPGKNRWVANSNLGGTEDENSISVHWRVFFTSGRKHLLAENLTLGRCSMRRENSLRPQPSGGEKKSHSHTCSAV